jgi:hypothetical protein
MSRASRLAVPLFVLVPLIAASPVRADPVTMPAGANVTADAAAALQTQIRAWVADLTGPAIDLGSHALRVTPEGAAYRFEVPLMGPVASTGWVITGAPITAIAKPLDGGGWTIQSVRLPSPIRADQPAGPDGSPRNWMLTLAGQEAHGRFDPTLRSPSSFDTVLRGYVSVTQTAAGTQTMHYDRYTAHLGWFPAGDGRVTVTNTGQGQNLTVFVDRPAGAQSVTVSAGSVRSTGRVERIAFDRLGAIMRDIGGLVPSAIQAASAAAAPNSIAPADRPRLHDLVAALGDLLGGVQAETTLERVRLDLGGQRGSLASLTVGGRAAAPGGMLDASLHVAMAGIDSPLIPQGPLRDYVPRRIALTPHLSGIPAHDLIALLLHAIDTGDQTSLQADAIALLAKGPLKAGLDDVVLDLGGTVLKANGAVTIAALDDIKGSARVDATGLDTLIHNANTVPELASAAPFLIVLKGIGDQKGDITTWNITYANGQTKVNGTDMSTLMPASPAKPDK